MQDLTKLEKRVTKALANAITMAAENPLDAVFEIFGEDLKPEVIAQAARAAAAVLMVYRRSAVDMPDWLKGFEGGKER